MSSSNALGALTLILGLTCLGCRQPANGSHVDPGGGPPAAESPSDNAAAPEPHSPPGAQPRVPERVDLPLAGEEAERWLFVERVSADRPGGWATGSFDAALNKFAIQTTDVQAFVIDTRLLKVNWQRPVVLRIDKSTSELRRRKTSMYRFERDPQAGWVVGEP